MSRTPIMSLSPVKTLQVAGLFVLITGLSVPLWRGVRQVWATAPDASEKVVPAGRKDSAVQNGGRIERERRLNAASELDRSPVDIALSPDGKWLVTANQIANTVSLLDTHTASVVAEAACGEHPVDVEFTPDGRRLLLTTQWSGLLQVFSVTEGALVLEGEVRVGVGSG